MSSPIFVKPYATGSHHASLCGKRIIRAGFRMKGKHAELPASSSNNSGILVAQARPRALLKSRVCLRGGVGLTDLEPGDLGSDLSLWELCSSG